MGSGGAGSRLGASIRRLRSSARPMSWARSINSPDANFSMSSSSGRPPKCFARLS